MAYTGRPGGVTLVAVLAWLTAILQIGLSTLILIGVLSPEGISIPSTWVALVIGIITLLVSFGLFSGNRVARAIVTVSLALSIISAVLQAVLHQDGNVLVGSIVTVLLAGSGVALLYTARANQFFS